MVKKYLIPVSICLVVMVVSIGILQWRSLDADDRMISQQETASGDNTDTASQKLDTHNSNPAMNTAPPSAQAYEENGVLIIGDSDAPVTILEYSSLSCPHCATFHKNTLADIKADYVNTGQVKFVFNDFPLNAPAMAGSLLLKCIPIENRYDFMEMLFDQQAQWAFDANYNNKLQQYASLMGIGSAEAEACMTNQNAQAAIIRRMQQAGAAFEISSTPSFIIQPGDEKLVGPQPYGAFSTRIEALLKDDAE